MSYDYTDNDRASLEEVCDVEEKRGTGNQARQEVAMNKTTFLVAMLCMLGFLLLPGTATSDEGRGLRSHNPGWVIYRYPLFREGNRPPAARRYSQTDYWPYDAAQRYPKFYGGFHSRYFDRIGRPDGDLGLRGYAW